MFEIRCLIEEEKIPLMEAWLYNNQSISWSIYHEKSSNTYELLGHFEIRDEAIVENQIIHDAFPEIPKELPIQALQDRDWQDAYKAFLQPWSYEDLHWVPVWLKDSYALPKSHTSFIFDAGMAFGTGNHESTRLCAARLIDYRNAHRKDLSSLSVLDIGCGSGILAISAALLGFKHVIGLDIDSDAVRISQENQELNAIDPPIRFFTAGIEEGLFGMKAHLIFANIQSNVLIPNAKSLLLALNRASIFNSRKSSNASESSYLSMLSLSGIITSEIQEVASAFQAEAKALDISVKMDSRKLGDWSDLCIFTQ